MEASDVKRRLTCILAADAVGYSKQMGQDEEGTIHVLRAHRAVIDGIIAFHHGRIVNTAGDSVIAEFSSAVEAVRCAVEIQEALRTRNDSLSDHRKMLFRVGVNLGDVVVNKDDLLGDGVNVAARLESMAEPGGICIASSVYDQITGKLDLGFQDIGQQNLKNISRPIHVYRVSGAVPPIAAMQPALQPVPATAAPSPVGRSPLLWVGGGLALLLIAVGVGWQSGWIRVGAPQPLPLAAIPAVTAPAAVSIPAPAVEAASAVPMPLAPRPAPAKAAEVKPAKPVAVAAPAQNPAPAPAAQPVLAPAQAIAPVTPPPVLQPAATAPVNHSPPPVPAGVSRFDGRWKVLVECTRHDGGALGYRVDLYADVKDGWLRGEFGTPGNPGWLLMEGAIRADGNALLIAKGLTGDPKYNVRSEATGTPFGYQVRARFDAQSGSGVRMQVRPCGVTFARQ